jgi:LysM repeat protein
MNTPNPLVPQGTFKDKGKSHVRITVFAILAIHVVLLGVLLIAGCNKKAADQAQDNGGLPPIPPPPTEGVWPPPPTSPAPAAVTQEVAGVPPPVAPPHTEAVAPPQPPNSIEPVTTGFSEHTIAKGESFYTLGKKYNVGFKAIADANPGINPNRLKIGDKVKIPPPKTPGAASFNGSTVAAGESATKVYTVKSGDNLLKIAKIYGVTAKQLRSENNLRTDQIKVGQKLKIPMKAPAPPPIEATSPPPAVPTAPPGFPPPTAQ